SLPITISPPFWETALFKILTIICIGLILYFLYRSRIKSIHAKAAIKQQMAELEGKALRAQMNPHFIFNCLNAIKELIVTKYYKESYLYLSKFSKLLRMVLNNSEKNLISLQSEIEMNQLYLELESLRFKKSFFYEINIDKDIDAEIILFPSLLIQPFIENAIWHGLMHKNGEKQLNISFKTENDKLTCSIDDNGIGRLKSAVIKSQKLGAHHFDSKGTVLAQQRIETLNKSGFKGALIKIADKYDTQNNATGTTVEITIPLQKNTQL
ncbi:MAG: histidine kinase, partial [Ferruginibacter sp.]|nr:histidine kinase [Ferruginibacter sp.]